MRVFIERSFLLAALLVWGSCLYWAGINHVPAAEIIFDEGVDGVAVNGAVYLTAIGTDPDEDRVTYRWYAEVVDEEGEHHTVIDIYGTLGKTEERRPVSTATAFSLQIKSRGTYTVELVVSDTLGAESTRARTFEVKNQAPVLELSRIRLDNGDIDATVGENDVPGLGHYLLSAAKSTDFDDGLGCNANHTISFKLLKPAMNPFTLWKVVKCDAAANEVLDKFEFGRASVSEETDVEIEVILSDLHGGETTKIHKLTLLPNRPPCIQETSPSLSQEKVWVPYDIEGEEGLTFQIVRLVDDVHETEYRWQLSDSPDGPFVDSLFQPGFQLELDAWSAGAVLGEAIYLRVIALDGDKTMPTCDVGERLCVEGNELMASCYRWVTWEVLFQ